MHKKIFLILGMFLLMINLAFATEYIYNEDTKMCEGMVEANVVCEPTFSFNPISGYCEKTAPTSYLCDYDWDEETKVCSTQVVVDIERVCPEGTRLTQDSRGRYSCIYEPDLTPECIQGTYDESLDKCVYTPDSEAECGSDTYDSVRDICIHEPEREIFCPQGSWDLERNACVIQPDLSYLCINGELTADKQSCVITPRVRIICPLGTSYDVDSGVCIEQGEVIVDCPEGSVYSSVQDKCIKSPEEIIFCPYGTEYDSEKGICTREITIQDMIKEKDIKIFGWQVGIGAFSIGIIVTLVLLFFILSKKR